jgi:hypothetical protein
LSGGERRTGIRGSRGLDEGTQDRKASADDGGADFDICPKCIVGVVPFRSMDDREVMVEVKVIK